MVFYARTINISPKNEHEKSRLWGLNFGLGKEIVFKVFKPLKAAAAAAKNKNFMIVKKDLDARRKASKLKAQS